MRETERLQAIENHRREIEKHFGIGRRDKDAKEGGGPLKTHSSDRAAQNIYSPQNRRAKMMSRHFSSASLSEVKEEARKGKKGLNAGRAFHSTFEAEVGRFFFFIRLTS